MAVVRKDSPQRLQWQTTEVFTLQVHILILQKENIRLTKFSTAAQWCYGLNTCHQNTSAMEQYINLATNATTAQPHAHIYQLISAYVITIQKHAAYLT